MGFVAFPEGFEWGAAAAADPSEGAAFEGGDARQQRIPKASARFLAERPRRSGLEAEA